MTTDGKHTLDLRGHDGIRLAADAWGSPDDPPVFLLHGGGQTRHAWGDTARAIAAEGWHAISVDLRGHGDSDWCPDGGYGHSDFAADVTALASASAAPPVLVGASLGGIASLLAVGESPTPLASALVLVDIAVRMEPSGVERIVQFMQARPEGFDSLEEAADAVAAYTSHRRRPRSLQGLAKNLRQGDDGRWRWHWDPQFLNSRHRNAAMHQTGLLERAARGLELPTLLVRGRESDLLSAEGAREFLDLVPHARFRDVSGAGHMIAGDRNELFTEAVLEFLRDVAAAPDARSA